MVAALVVLAILLGVVASAILLFAGMLGSVGIPSTVVAIGLLGLACLFLLLARLSQAGSQHRKMMDLLNKGG